MSNPNAAKGARTEKEAVDFLAEVHGRAAYRPHAEGFKDVGDIHLDPFVVQCKNFANTTAALNEGVKGADLQKTHAGLPYGVALIKKRGAGIGEARVAMTLRTFRDVVARLRRAEALLARHAPEVFHTEHLPAEQPPTDSQTYPLPEQETKPETEQKDDPPP